MSKHLVILLLLSAVVYSANSWKMSVYVLDEARNAGCAMEMFQRNDWVVPTFNDELRTDKPPLHYFFMQLSYRAFGINAFSARLYAMLMGVFTTLCVYFFGSKLASAQAGFLASLILIASIQLAVQFHLAVPDPCLIFFLTFGYLSFIYAFLSHSRGYYYLFYISLALATLSKGPVAIVFAGLTILIFLIVQRRFSIKTLLEIRLMQGILIFIILVLPWYIMVGVATHGEWLEQFFFKHNIGRFTTTMEGHRGFPLASVVIAIGALIPFSFFFPQAIRKTWRVRKTNPFLQFCLIAFGVIVIFFTFSRTILPNYLEPALPFFAILLGFYFDGCITSAATVRADKLYINAIVYVFVALAVPAAVWIGLSFEESLADLRYLALYFSVLPLGAIVGLYYIVKERVAYAFYTYAGSSVLLLLLFFYVIFPRVDNRNPVSGSISLVLRQEKPVLYYRDFNPAFVFALRHTIAPFENPERAGPAGLQKGYFLLTQKRFLRDLDSLGATVVFERKDLFEGQTTVILEK